MPIAMITGTAGKTTTTRLTASILKAAGHRVGAATTDGVEIDGQLQIHMDLAGHPGHRQVLRTSGITAAVLETARGGILRLGFYVRPVMAAAITNVGDDHIGMNGVRSIEQMTRVKARVAACSRGQVVLNADNQHTLELAKQYPANRVTLVTVDENAPVVSGHLARGGQIVCADDKGVLVHLLPDGNRQPIVPVADIPVTLGGALAIYVSNALMAAGLGLALGATYDAIKQGLTSFVSDPQTNPGRFNLVQDYNFNLYYDRSMNGHGAIGLIQSLDQLKTNGQRILCCSMPGNRSPEQYKKVTKLIAGHFDHYVAFDLERYRRKAPPGEITRRMIAGLRAAGELPERIHQCTTFESALAKVNELVKPGDNVILTVDIPNDLPMIKQAFEKHLKSEVPLQ